MVLILTVIVFATLSANISRALAYQADRVAIGLSSNYYTYRKDEEIAAQEDVVSYMLSLASECRYHGFAGTEYGTYDYTPATKERILDAARAYGHETDIVFYSGHGDYDYNGCWIYDAWG